MATKTYKATSVASTGTNWKNVSHAYDDNDSTSYAYRDYYTTSACHINGFNITDLPSDAIINTVTAYFKAATENSYGYFAGYIMCDAKTSASEYIKQSIFLNGKQASAQYYSMSVSGDELTNFATSNGLYGGSAVELLKNLRLRWVGGSTQGSAGLFDAYYCQCQVFDTYVTIDYTVPTYALDLKGKLDNGTENDNISNWGTADIYINGSIVSSGVSDYYESYTSGTTYEVKNIVANSGYKYVGNSSYSGTLTSNTTIVLPFETKTACTITYNGNGATSGSVAAQSGYVRDSLTLRDNGFVKKCNVTYYSNENPNIVDDSLDELQTSVSSATFLGWYTAAEGGTRVGGSGDSYTPSGDTTLYAHWSAAVTTPTPTRDGYTLLGWYTERSGGTKVADGGGSYTPTGNIALYAHWKINSTNMIYIGTKQPTFYIGTKQVQSIYLGMSLIYEIVTIVDSGTCGSNLTYTLDSHGVLTISGTGDMQNSSFGWDKDLIKSVVINYGVTNIGQGAFEDCTGLTSITIPNGVTSIGWNAFRNCTSLTIITIPDSVTSIGVAAFYRCSGLTSVAIPDSITSIGDIAFWDCNGLTSITIPDRVTSIGEGVFAACNNLTKITVSSGNTVYHSTDNCLIETETKTLISGCKSSIIPTDGSVTSIGNRTFEDCTGLTSITIPNGVTSIGWRAFWSCFDLTRVIIPNSVTNIGDWAFQSCSCLTSITIPDSVTSIGEGAFKGCTGLTSITIPSSVTSIGDSMFRDCTNLTEIDFSTHTTVPTLNSTNAFSNTPANLVIKVPSDLLDEWKAATNWVAYADKIVGFK